MKPGIFLLCILCLVLTACSGGTTPQAEDLYESVDQPIKIADEPAAMFRGRLVPARFMQASFAISGQVREVLVKEGDSVKAGDVLARLGNQEELKAEVAEAELNYLSAKQAYLDLEANLVDEQARALDELNLAKRTLEEFQNQIGFRTSSVAAADDLLALARVNVAITKKALDRAFNEYRPYVNKPADDNTRAALLQEMLEAQKNFERAEEKLNSLLNGKGPSEVDLNQVQTELEIIQANIVQAQKRYDLLLEGPDPKEVEAAQARMNAAEATLAAAEAALGKLALQAPMDGVVTDLRLTVGQNISPDQIALAVVDFSKWYVETDRLTEDQIVYVTLGQKAILVPKVLPDLQLSGRVDLISNAFVENQGEVSYRARILVEEVDPRLRWGMTVDANLEKPSPSQ